MTKKEYPRKITSRNLSYGPLPSRLKAFPSCSFISTEHFVRNHDLKSSIYDDIAGGIMRTESLAVAPVAITRERNSVHHIFSRRHLEKGKKKWEENDVTLMLNSD